MNSYIIILILSIFMELLFFFGTMHYFKKISINYAHPDQLGLEESIQINANIKHSVKSAFFAIVLSVIAALFSIYINNNYIIHILGATLIFISIIKYFFIKQYAYKTTFKILQKN